MDGLECRFDHFPAFGLEVLRILDDQNRVLGRQADDGEQADLEINVVWQPAQFRGEQRAQDAERTTRMTESGMDQLS